MASADESGSSTAILTSPTEDGFDGQLMFSLLGGFSNESNLIRALDVLIPAAADFCKSANIIPFFDLVREYD